ncbi:MAG TPA: c-type cytochrome [Conexibacter sp.]|nr:c-type cytochrome [Conexibacter sp.]
MSPWRRRPLLPRRARVVLAFACGSLAFTLALGGLVGPPGGARQSDAATVPAATAPAAGGAGAAGAAVGAVAGASSARVAAGRRLFQDTCSSCHGANAQGIPGVAPSLRGVGALAADFYVRTGRMPLRDPHQQPLRKESFYSHAQMAALIAYVGSFGGPAIPPVHPAAGDLALGFRLFGEDCMGCHQVVAQGGLTTGAWVPSLQRSRPLDVAEAVQIGPYVMPRFTAQLTQHDVDSLARYVLSTHHPDDAGGWGIGHIGPIPEGMVTWLLAGAALILTIRLIGERTSE